MDPFDREWLMDMLEHAREAQSMLGDMDASALRADRKTLHAVSNVLQIIGEAANRVSATRKAAGPAIPWNEIIRMRHRLVHGYRTRDAEVLVKTVRGSLPSLIADLDQLLKDQNP